MSYLQQTLNKYQAELSNSGSTSESGVVLVREAGVPFQQLLDKADPIAEWISLMEVVQMLCPVWPVRDEPMRGSAWKL